MRIIEEYDEVKTQDLDTFDVEISYAGTWIDLNDMTRYVVHAESMQSTAKSYRRITTTSPIVPGDTLIHAVPETINETLKIRVLGQDQVDLSENVEFLVELFEQFTYNIRITRNNMREQWRCQMVSALNIEAAHVYLHNTMTMVTATVPRYPVTSRERAI